ncbi:hypothetical protein BT69DRAFT_1335169 [Atractiella rhizophila]|nr:hypothetical protein BT69DRAFT_1335169 [Atractiella rhizophila]
MPKTARFRNRKINFKARLPVKLGALDTGHDDGFIEDYRANGHDSEKVDVKGEPEKLETGVDKDDEGEYHLQAAINASLASLQSTAASLATKSEQPQKSAPSTSQIPYIPTPDATGTISDETYNEFYRSKAFIPPHSNIRFSDTVEDSMLTGEVGGAATYTMDEEDESWLLAWNAGWEQNGKLRENEEGKRVKMMVEASTSNGLNVGLSNGKVNTERTPAASVRSSPRGKGKEPATPAEGSLRRMTEGELEVLMEFFEQECDVKAPSLHTELSLLPTCQEFEESLLRATDPFLLSLRQFVKVLYIHWRQRKIQREGKSIIPQLDFDETNENNPYVCFRRRDVKMARKTRRSDQQNVERLQRIFKDLLSSRDLLSKVLERETLKADLIKEERRVFDSRSVFRELKRRAGEDKGDEDILVGPRTSREKKRKRPPVDESADQSSKRQNGPSLERVVRKGTSIPQPAFSLVPSQNDIFGPTVEKEKRAALIAKADNELNVRFEQDEEWQDAFDDEAIKPLPSISHRYYRIADDILIHGPKTRELPSWEQKSSDRVESKSFRREFERRLPSHTYSFRRRIGRGGRVLVDRILPRPTSPLLQSSGGHYDLSVDYRHRERFRYDNDIDEVFPPGTESMVLDDFNMQQFSVRFNGLNANDLQLVEPDASYLREARRWAEKPIDRPAMDYEVVGKLPSNKNPNTAMYLPTPAGMNVAGLPAIGAFGIPGVQRLPPNHNAIAMQQRMAMQNSHQIRRANQPNSLFNGVPNVAQHWQASGAQPTIPLLASHAHVLHQVPPSSMPPNLVRNANQANGQIPVAMAISGSIPLPTVQVHNSPPFAHPSAPPNSVVNGSRHPLPFQTAPPGTANGAGIHPMSHGHPDAAPAKSSPLSQQPPPGMPNGTPRPASSTSVHASSPNVAAAPAFLPMSNGSPILRQKLRSPANGHHLNGMTAQSSPLVTSIKALNVAPNGFTIYPQPSSSPPQPHHVSAQNG